MPGEAVPLPLFDQEPEKSSGKKSCTLEEALLHAKELSADFGLIDINTPVQQGARQADGSRIQVPTRASQHHDKSLKGVRQMGVSHEPTRDEIKDLWFNND